MKKSTYFDNRNINLEEYLNAYNDYMSDEHEDWVDVEDDDPDFQDWVYNTMDLDWEDFEANTDPISNERVTINGSLGLWTGRHEIEEVETTFGDALSRCLSSGCDFVRIYVAKDGDDLTIEATHHDGTNVFSIHFEDEKIQNGYLY